MAVTVSDTFMQSLLQLQTAGVDSGVGDDNVYGDVGTSNGNGKSTSSGGSSSKHGTSNSRGGTGVSTSGTSTSGAYLNAV
jgi:hypothetical protein